MKRKRRGSAVLLSAVLAAVMLSGCGGASDIEYTDISGAKEALNTASEVYFSGDLGAVNQQTDILADGRVAGYMEETGLLDPKWTVTIDGETWFYVKFVTDEPINEDHDDVSTGTTYGYYDKNGTCLGYAQKWGIKGGSMVDYMVYLDADGNPKDYYSDENGYETYDKDDNIIVTGTGGTKNIISKACHVQLERAEGYDTQVDFMDMMVMYIQLYDELYDSYGD